MSCCGIGSGANVIPSGGSAPATEIPFLVNERGTDSATYVRVGGRPIDMSKYPATFGSLNRVVTFVADLDIAGAPTSATVKLYDLTHLVDVTGSEISHNTTTNTDISSAALTVGGNPGDIRDDVVTQYVAYLKMVGGSVGVDQAFCTNARLVIDYV